MPQVRSPHRGARRRHGIERGFDATLRGHHGSPARRPSSFSAETAAAAPRPACHESCCREARSRQSGGRIGQRLLAHRPAGARRGLQSPPTWQSFRQADEWYVAINGVPVGPIRIAEVRRKAALGGVTEESLAWQEGWTSGEPVRTFPELAAIVREAIATGPVVSLSRLPRPRAVAAFRPAQHAQRDPRVCSRRHALRMSPHRGPRLPRRRLRPAATSCRSLRVLRRPRSSRKRPTNRPVAPSFEIPSPMHHLLAPHLSPWAIADDTWGSPDSPSVAAPVPLATSAGPGRRAPPWIAIGMVAAFVAFGAMGGIAFFFRPAPPPAPVVVQMPAPLPSALPTPATSPIVVEPEPVVTATLSTKKAGATKGESKDASASPLRGLDLHSLAQNQNIAPTEDPAGDAPTK